MTVNIKEIRINTEYITLGKFLKYVNAVDSGAIAKIVISEGEVFVNQEIETRRGRKLRDNDTVSYNGVNYLIRIDNED